VNVQIDRERAGLLGVNVQDVTRSLVAATTSSRFTFARVLGRSGQRRQFQCAGADSRRAHADARRPRQHPVTSSSGKPVLLRNLAKIEQGTAVGTYERYNMVRVASITANIQGVDFGSAIKAVRKAIAEVGPAPDGKTKVDMRGQVVPYEQLYTGFSSGLVIAIVVIFLAALRELPVAAPRHCRRLHHARRLAGVVLALFFTGTTINIQSAMGAIMAVGVAVANAILLVTFADRARLATKGDRRAAAIEGAVSRLRPILMTSFAMIAGMMPMALGLGEGGDQTAPLGRAVVGGLALATVATLFILPAVFAMLASKKATSASLDPDDEESALFEGTAPVLHHRPTATEN
jgi:multidrug efflux pump subunit AcrB